MPRPYPTLPQHGPITCSFCFKGDDKVQTEDKWRICNDPGAWGASEPKVLVLGFSKGFTQANAFDNSSFDSIAFSGMRPRLKSALTRLRLMDDGQDIDRLLTKSEMDFAFGSLVRCSLSRLNEKNGKWEATGPLIKKAFKEEPALSWIRSCMHRYLRGLPNSVQLVVLLGNDTGYINLVKHEIAKIYPEEYEDINEVAYKTGGRTWVHVAHPSGLNGHFNTWLDGDASTTPGRKRELAIEAITNRSAKT